ncbi:MAG: type II and III secretion system protein [Puniceicoccales bacterium]|nr:type II and III secretion system protein [Puniceicoccales bacterium]
MISGTAKFLLLFFVLTYVPLELVDVSSNLRAAIVSHGDVSALQKKIISVSDQSNITVADSEPNDSSKTAMEPGCANGTSNRRKKVNVTFFSEKNPARLDARKAMLEEVSENWRGRERENADGSENPEKQENGDENSLADTVGRIIVPQVRFSETPLSHAVEALAGIAEKNNPNDSEEHVNFVLLGKNSAENEPRVSLNLKNVSLLRLIEFVAKSAGYQFDIGHDAVIFYRSEMGGDIMETQFFPVSRATLVRLTGMQGINHRDKKNLEISETMADEERAVKEFFQRAGVNFSNVSGSDLAFDGAQIIVTNTCRNLKKIRNILEKYSDVKQVEIETKFLEVQQGVLDELGFNWQFANRKNPDNRFFQTWQSTTNGSSNRNLRTLAGAFAGENFSIGVGKIVSGTPPETVPIQNNIPGPPGQINLGVSSSPLANFTGVLDSVQCSIMIRALEQHAGSDLMSAPKLTVLSGKTAEITIAMELRYPQKYGDIRSEVGTTSSGNGVGGAAGVTITSGTPQDFTTRNVGVEMKVTPTVETDGSISLQLEPKVTELEGFVEYGGMSVATSSQATVYVPSGFYQPIFSTREIRTEVNVFDGATVVMGGLTREEVKEVHDKVPILGDIPLIGWLFRSKSETTQKRNLLIFVTAHTISPAGEKMSSKNFDKPNVN